MGTFPSLLATAELSDIEYIFDTPLPGNTTASGPCQEGCELAYKDEMFQHNMAFKIEVANASLRRDFAAIPAICAYWNCMIAEAAAGRITCLSVCV